MQNTMKNDSNELNMSINRKHQYDACFKCHKRMVKKQTTIKMKLFFFFEFVHLTSSDFYYIQCFTKYLEKDYQFLIKLFSYPVKKGG